MDYVIEFIVIFTYTSILWVIVLAIYNALIEAFDFGPLIWFAAKSALLISIVSLCLLVPAAGWLLSFAVWWVGLVLVFKKDFWECRVLVILIWGANVIFGLLIEYLIRFSSLSHPAMKEP